MKNNSVIVIGAGIGGLAAGIRLAAEGYRVRVLEKNSRPGGQLRSTRIGDFVFPNAGALLTMPEATAALFDSAGRSMADYMTLREVSPILRFIFPGEGEYTFYREAADTLMKNVLFGLKDQQAFASYGKRSDYILNEVLPRFFDKPYKRPRGLFASEFGFRTLNPGRSGVRVSNRLFSSAQLRTAHAFWPLFSGGAPSASSHFYRMIPAAMSRWGVYHVEGGPDAYVDGLVKLLLECDGEVQYNSEVEAIQIYNGVVTGVRLTDNSVRQADYVVCDADTAYSCRFLIDSDRVHYTTVDKALARRPGCSVFIYHMAFETPPAALRDFDAVNILMPRDARTWERQLFAENRLPDELLMYLNFPGKMEEGFVPEGHGAMTAVVFVPNLSSDVNWKQVSYQFRERVLNALQPYFGTDLRASLIGERYLTPVNFHEDMNAYMGAAWGFDPNQEKTDIRCLPNGCDDVRNLFFVGSGAHPGPHIPAVLKGAELVNQSIVNSQ